MNLADRTAAAAAGLWPGPLLGITTHTCSSTVQSILTTQNGLSGKSAKPEILKRKRIRKNPLETQQSGFARSVVEDSIATFFSRIDATSSVLGDSSRLCRTALRYQVDMCVIARIRTKLHALKNMKCAPCTTLNGVGLTARSFRSHFAGAKFVVEKQSEVENMPGLVQIIEIFLNILPQPRSKPLHEPIKSFLKVCRTKFKLSTIFEKITWNHMEPGGSICYFMRSASEFHPAAVHNEKLRSSFDSWYFEQC